MQAKLFAFLLLMLSTTNVLTAGFKKDATTTTTTTPATTTNGNTTTTADSSHKDKEKADTPVATKNSKLTGIPQVDYIYDPNLPRELRGYNLSSYPFFSTVPPNEDIHFKCDGLHDGFYASIEFKCQIYHHCVYGIRHDFLCANFTAFDQKTFICHFVSDVDCEGSKKYWNRNDNLYMATTTTTTTTTTTEPPPTMKRRTVRPLRPLRRPLKRRPIDDYYYDEEYEDDYYAEPPVNRRPLPGRARPKKPLVDYDYEYERDRNTETGSRRHSTNRNRFREEEPPLEEDYDSPRPAAKPLPNERRKPTRQPVAGGLAGRHAGEERRSFVDERPERPLRKDKPHVIDNADDAAETPYVARRQPGRRRANAHSAAADQQAEEVQEERLHTTPKPIEELVTPKAAAQSVYARPRVPPRIPRPVPMNEKNKFQYPVRNTATTVAPIAPASPEEEAAAPIDDYYDEEDYAYGGARAPPARRRRIQDNVDSLDERGGYGNGRKRFRNEQRLKTQRFRNQKKGVPAYDDYDSEDEEPVNRVPARRPGPYAGRRRTSLAPPAAAIDAEEADVSIKASRPLRKKIALPAIKTNKRPVKEQQVEEGLEELEEEEKVVVKTHKIVKKPTATPVIKEVPVVDEVEEELEPEIYVEEEQSRATIAKKPVSPIRVIKRPFLPSRGGSPYLPRGLQPVGVAPKQKARLLQAPKFIVREEKEREKEVLQHNEEEEYEDVDENVENISEGDLGTDVESEFYDESDVVEAEEKENNVSQQQQQQQQQLLHEHQQEAQQQQHEQVANREKSQVTLDALYENDYDVTINDALNPTLKPLSPQPLTLHQNIHQRTQSSASASASAIASASASVNKNNLIKKSTASSSSTTISVPISYTKKNSTAFASIAGTATASSSSSPTSSSSLNHSHANVGGVSKLNHQLRNQFHQTSYYGHQQLQQQQQRENFKSDSNFSSTDLRRRAIIQAAPATTEFKTPTSGTTAEKNQQQQQQQQQRRTVDVAKSVATSAQYEDDADIEYEY